MSEQKMIAAENLDKHLLNARQDNDHIDPELKASIAAHGLLQSLLVTEGENGRYKVLAGGQRLNVIRQLQAEKVLPGNYMVPCIVVQPTSEEAFEKSLAENVVRHAMSPADEFEAFARLAAKGESADAIAARFGIEPKLVLKRLRLGKCSPVLIKAYREGKMDLDALMAFTITEDHKRQEAVFKSLKGGMQGNLRDHYIRRALTDKMVKGNDSLANFIGIDAYKKAGGAIRQDLFGEVDYLENAQLVQKLANEKIAATVERVKKEGWLWVEGVLERDYNFINRCDHVQPKDKKYSAEQMQKAGAYVYMDYNGKLEIERGLVRPQEKRLLAKKGAAGAAKKDSGNVTDILRRALEADRLQIAQLAIATNPYIAYDLMVFNAARAALIRPTHSGPDISFTSHAPGTDKSEACKRMLALKEKLPMDWAKKKTEAEQFDAFRALKQDDKMILLAFCVAKTLRPQIGVGEVLKGAYEASLGLTGVNVAALWRPTADNYLSRITTDQLLRIAKEIVPARVANALAGDKKSVLVKKLEAAFAKPSDYPKEEAQKMAQWLPIGMAFTAAPEKKPSKKKAA